MFYRGFAPRLQPQSLTLIKLYISSDKAKISYRVPALFCANKK